MAVSLPACFGDRSQGERSQTAPPATQAAPASPTPNGIDREEPTIQADTAPQDEPGDRGEPALEGETPEETGSRRTGEQATETPGLPAFRPPSPTPTPARPLLAATPFASPEGAISQENIARLIELARWGKGEIHQMLWSPDGSLLAVACSTGIYFYDRASLNLAGWIDAQIDSFTELAFSPDGKLLAAGFIKTTARVWEVPEGKLLQSFPELRWKLGNRLVFSPDGSFLIAGGASEVSIWGTADRSLVLQTAAANGAWTLSPDGLTLAAASSDRLTFYDVSGGTTRFSMDLPGQLSSMTYAPDGSSLALAFFDSSNLDWTVQIVRASDGSLLQTLAPQIGDLPAQESSWKDRLQVAFAPGGASLAFSSNERRSIELWDTESWTPVFHAEDEQYAFSPDGMRLASWSYNDPILRVWRSADGTQAYSISSHAYGVSQAIYTQDGETLATVDGTRILRLWNAANGGAVRAAGEIAAGRGQLAFPAAEASGEREPVFAALFKDGTLQVWQAASGQLIERLENPASIRDSLAFTPDGEALSYRSQNGEGCVLRVSDGSPEACFPEEDEDKLVQAISPNGATAFTLQEGAYMVRGSPYWLLNTADPEIQIKLTLPFSLTMAAFTADGESLFLASPHGEIVEVRTRDGSPLRRFALALEEVEAGQARIETLSLSPNGQIFVSSNSEGSIDLWKVSDGSRQTRLEMQANDPGSVKVAFSSGGLLAASASGQPIEIFRLSDGTLVQEIENDSGYSGHFAFLPGDELLAVGAQKRVRFWQIATGRLLGSLQTQAWISSLAVSPNGRLLATATEDGLIQIWGVYP